MKARTIDSYLLQDTLKSASILARSRSGWRLINDANTIWFAKYAKGGPVYSVKCFESARPLKHIKVSEGDDITFNADCAEGEITVKASPTNGTMRCQVWLKPAQSLLLEGSQEELFFGDTDGESIISQKRGGSGIVFGKAAQLYFLYLQNFTNLNRFFEDTDTRPTETVRGEFPQVGFRRPHCQKPLRAGRKYQILDTYLATTEEDNEFRAFLRLLDDIYQRMPKPETEFFDWREQTDRTIDALAKSPKCSILIEGKKYLLPYVRGGRPDSLTQLHTLAWLFQVDLKKARNSQLREELSQTIPSFLNQDDGRLERFPCFGDNDCGQTEKIDSWYSIFALLSLAEIAKSGDVGAFECFEKSLGFIIKAARKFDYDFPVFFDSKTFKIIQKTRGENQQGQTDVAGLYAWVMLHAFDLTQDTKYLSEAKESLLDTGTKSFDLCYQTNITAWGAAAAFRCWKDFSDDRFYDLGVMYLANFFRYCNFFEADYGHAAEHPCFFSVMALSSSEYPAMLENSDSLAALSDIVRRCDKDLPDWLSRLCNEYCKYSLHHCRFYFPDQLPEKILSKNPREGEIDRELPLALEDLYVNAEKEPGSVGQEIYGSCGAFVMFVSATAEVAALKAVVHCEYPFTVIETPGEGVEIRIAGRRELKCRLTVTADSLAGLTIKDGKKKAALGKAGKRAEYTAAGGSTIILARGATQ